MILHRLTFRGLSTEFAEREVMIDFDALPDGLTALIGTNGAGKSHVLELAGFATLFREFAGYGETFASHVADGVRDAYSELVFELAGVCYRVRVQCDPLFGGGRGKTEAYLSRLDGEAWTALAGPGVNDVKLALAPLVPSKELFLASVFSCQGGGGNFFSLPKAERKALFVRLLGLEHLQVQAEAARARVQQTTAEVARVREQVAPVRVRAERLAALTTECAALAERHTLATSALAERTTEVAHTEATLVAARAALSEGEAANQRVATERARLTRDQEVARETLGELRVRLEQLDTTLADADTIRAAAAELPALDERLAALATQERAAGDALAPLTATIATLTVTREQLLREATPVTAAINAATVASTASAASMLDVEAEGARAAIEVAEKALAAIGERFPAVEAAADAETAIAVRRRELETRARDLTPRTRLLATIPNVPECAACPLTDDARGAADAVAEIAATLATLADVTGLPARQAFDALAADRRQREAARDVASRWLSANEAALRTLAEQRTLAATLGTKQAELAAIVARGRDVRAQLDTAQADQRAKTAAREGLEAERATLEITRRERALVAARLSEIATAEATRTERLREQAATDARLAELAIALTALVAIDLAPLVAAATEATAADTAARTALTAAHRVVADLQRDLDRLDGERRALGDPASELAALTEREHALTTEASDWAVLERALGRDGVQALELDAASHAVTGPANDLLATCYGTRFSIDLPTSAEKKTGGQRETFELRLIDNKTGREAKQGSPGEMALISEALTLAIGNFTRERSGFALGTLYRDETTAALAPENGNVYVAMLRRAMALGGYRRCLFITHMPTVAAQADVRLAVGGGTVRVDDDGAALATMAAAA